ncbi:MAG: LacI family DNA-binding transcriptional regulator [Deinococcales bacterium]
MSLRKRPTMKDVAALARVSQTTVSFVVNNAQTAESIPLETKQRIEAAIESLGYRPNQTAKILRTNRSKVLGFITDKIATTPFAGDTIRGAQSAAWQNGYLLMLINTEGRAEHEQEAVDLLLDRQVDGIIYASMYTRELETLPKGLTEVPSILVDCFSLERESLQIDSIIPDEYYGSTLATEHLLARGHEKIAFINGVEGMYASGLRLQAFKEALGRRGIAPYPLYLRSGNWWPNSGYEHTLALMALDSPPTAIFCGNDRMALGAMQAIAKLGLSIPDDVAIIGYDDELIAKRVVPP